MDTTDPFPLSILRDTDGLLLVHHGTPVPGGFDRFRNWTYKRGMQLGFGIHTTVDRYFAEHYVGKNGSVLDCHLDVRKLLDVTGFIPEETEDHETARLLFAGSRRAHQWGHFSANGSVWLNLDLFDPKRVVRILRQRGYDGVRYQALHGSRNPYGMSVAARATSYVVFDPDQIRILNPAPTPVPGPSRAPRPR